VKSDDAKGATAWTAPRCEFDAGSMFDNAWRCEDAATQRITYRHAHYGTHDRNVCDRHIVATRGRIYPDPIIETVGLDTPARRSGGGA